MLGDLPTAILVETRSGVLEQLEPLVSDLGFETIVVSSVRALLRADDRGGDLQLIQSKTNLADYAPLETIDFVRRLHRGRSIPIVFYGDRFLGWDSARWDAPTLFMDQPVSVLAFDELLQEVDRRRRMLPLSTIDRRRYRREAEDLLTRGD